MDEYPDDFGPISMVDLAEECGVDVEQVGLVASRYAGDHGARLTFSDFDDGLPYERLTGDAAEYVRETLRGC